MYEYTVKEKIIIHLQNKGIYKDKVEVPYELCQAGISDKVDISQSQLSRILRELKDEKYIKEKTKHIEGLKHRRKVYFLTYRGCIEADKIMKKLQSEKIKIRTSNGLKEIYMVDIEDYIASNNPHLTALNLVNEDRVIDFNQIKTKEEDIFIGRQKEIEELKGELEKVKEGECRTVFISGEAGIGKTTLVSELEPYAKNMGFDFLIGNSYFENSDPYLPFREAFEKYLQKNNELNYSVSLLAASSSFDTDIDKKRIFDSRRQMVLYNSSRWIKKIADEKPLVVFLDDLQWADNATLQLFHYLSTRLDESPILFIGVYRPEDISEKHPLNNIMKRMSRLKNHIDIRLDQLDTEDIRDIITHLIGTKEVPNGFIMMIHEVTEGNPLFLKEIIKHMMDEGFIDPIKGKYPYRRDEITLPKIINDVIKRRLDKLETDTRNILQIGSVIGDDFSFWLLNNLLDMDELDILEKTDILIDSKILHEKSDEEVFYFTHNLVRKVVYNNISIMRKKHLHKAIANKIEEINKGDIEEQYSILAHHYDRAEEFPKALEYYMKAGKNAENRYAHEDAIEFYKRALDIYDKVEEKDIEKYSIIKKIAKAYKFLGKYEKVRKFLYLGIEEASTIEEKQEMYWKISNTWHSQGDFDKALEIIEKGLSLSREENNIRCKFLNVKGWIHYRKGEYDKAYNIFSEERSIAEDLEDKMEIALAFHNLGTTLIDKEDEYDKAKDFLMNVVDLQDEIWDELDISATYNNLGAIYNRKGDIDKALEYYERSLKIREKIGDMPKSLSSLINMGLVYRKRGDLNKAEIYFLDALEKCRKIEDKYHESLILGNLGRTYLAMDRCDKARDTILRSIDICRNNNYTRTSIVNYNGLGELYIKTKNYDKAEENIQKAYKKSMEIGSKIKIFTSQRLMGVLWSEKGRLVKAEEIFKNSIRGFEKIQSKIELAYTYYEYAVLLIKKGEREKAEEHYKMALSIFKETGINVWLEKTKKALENLEEDQ